MPAHPVVTAPEQFARSATRPRPAVHGPGEIEPARRAAAITLTGRQAGRAGSPTTTEPLGVVRRRRWRRIGPPPRLQGFDVGQQVHPGRVAQFRDWPRECGVRPYHEVTVTLGRDEGGTRGVVIFGIVAVRLRKGRWPVPADVVEEVAPPATPKQPAKLRVDADGKRRHKRRSVAAGHREAVLGWLWADRPTNRPVPLLLRFPLLADRHESY